MAGNKSSIQPVHSASSTGKIASPEKSGKCWNRLPSKGAKLSHITAFFAPFPLTSNSAYRCSFYPIWKAARGKWKCRAPRLVAEELAEIKEGFVYFCDDNAFFHGENMEALCHLIKEMKISKEYFYG